MGETIATNRIQVVRATAWRDAVIKILEPRSPYRPWRIPAGIKRGDAVLVVLETNPVSVIADIREVGVDGSALRALARFLDSGLPWREPPALLELATLRALTGFSLPDDGDPATVLGRAALTTAIGQRQAAPSGGDYLDGHTSLAAAAILLVSLGRCTGCGDKLDLAAADARDRLHIRSVDLAPSQRRVPVADDPPEEPRRLSQQGYGPDDIRIGVWRPGRFPTDWPAVLCDTCHGRMQHGGFDSFLRLRFSLHPPCPSCAAQWTMRTYAGFAAVLRSEPWMFHTGCCPRRIWVCAACGHEWGPSSDPEAG